MWRSRTQCFHGTAPSVLDPSSLYIPSVRHRPSTTQAAHAIYHAGRRHGLIVVRATQNEQQREVAALSDFLSFESSDGGPSNKRGGGTVAEKVSAEELVERATAALAAAREALDAKKAQTPARSVGRDTTFTYASSRPEVRATDAFLKEGEQERRRALLEEMLAAADRGSMSWDDAEDGPGWSADFPSSSSSGAGSSASSGSQEGLQPQLARAASPAASSAAADMDYAEPPAFPVFNFLSQDAQDVAAARAAVLPPLQSVLELTTAFKPPTRGEAPVSAQAAPSSAGQAMEDGKGVLADGTRYVRDSGEEFGANGFWQRWTRLRGVSAAGKVEWEEYWWEASDWAGMREMGAEKSGCRADGAAWRETWREAIAFDQANGEPIVERSAHKWARDGKGEEWEERWAEDYWSLGKAKKWADKWARQGPNVWHERWGEDYDGGGGCVKYTDKWAERLLEGGGSEQWGDKWEERFKDGAGSKQGETWTLAAGGERYQRWWGEDHFGNGWVRKHGNSTTGEHWDVSEQMDTYYNPVPHFGYKLALEHSPTLKRVPTLPRGGDDLEGGIDDL